jgi:cysteine desulfurase family protein (TIGR01976 family)
MSNPQNVSSWRREFPALEREVAGRPAAFLDGPAGSQVPQSVIDAVSRCLTWTNANEGGHFLTSALAGTVLAEASRAAADLLGADDEECIVFGPNMTTLTMTLARALARTWGPGDEILVTRLEHDANFTPWVQAASDAGATIRTVEIRPEDCTLDLDDLRSKLTERTRFVALGAASNAVGTVNPVSRVAGWAHEVGARVFVDAVHYAPHASIDVAEWDCDFLTCSAYKFYGPHVGILWGKRELLDTLPAYKLRPPEDKTPHRWMTGTQNHEGLAGLTAAVEHIAGIGAVDDAPGARRRDSLVAGFGRIQQHEQSLVTRCIEGLSAMPEVRVLGITDSARITERAPTVSFTHARRTPDEVARHLADLGIFVWDGNFYALPLTEALGLEPNGMVRVGFLHYNTRDEVDRLIEAVGSVS